MYDGTVGVLGGLEAILSLQRAGFRPKRSIELVMFTSEEPTRFGVGCTGSRLMSGAMSTEQLCKLKDDAGDDYDQVRLRAGFEGPIDQPSFLTTIIKHGLNCTSNKGLNWSRVSSTSAWSPRSRLRRLTHLK
jgi:hypothetical protein